MGYNSFWSLVFLIFVWIGYSAIYEMSKEATSPICRKFCAAWLSFPMVAIRFLILTILRPVAFLWLVFRGVFYGVENLTWNKYKAEFKNKRFFNNYYACYDETAEKLGKKVFLVRVKPLD